MRDRHHRVGTPAALRQFVAGAKVLLLMSLLLGLVYPALVLGIGRLAAPGAADGSLITRNGQVVGSSLLGQQFAGAQWFRSRPSASDWAGNTSGGTNLGPGPTLDAAVAARRAAAGLGGRAPADALTASGSGLDPDISPQYALAQVDRVAAARGLAAATVTALVEAHTQGRVAGFLGEPRVNVLELNLALLAVTSSGPGS